MSEENFLSGYRDQISAFSSSASVEERRQGAEVDKQFLLDLIGAHQLLRNGRLILTVSAAIPPGANQFADLRGYASVLNDAPFDFRNHLERLLQSGAIIIEGMEDQLIPDEIEIAVPPNSIPVAEDGTPNTFYSGGKLFSGELRQYLGIQTTRDVFLEINPSGLFLGEKLNMHPSLITNIQILQENSFPYSKKTIFRAIKNKA